MSFVHVMEKSMVMKTRDNEKMQVTITLLVSDDGYKLPPYLILNNKTA
jgi:hypothetical protein